MCGAILSLAELSDVLEVESDVSAAIAGRTGHAAGAAQSTTPPSLRPGTVHAASTPRSPNPATRTIRVNLPGGSRGDLRGSIAFFEQAIHDDPSYAEAYAGLAEATSFSDRCPTTASPARGQAQGTETAQRALQLNPRLPKLTPSSATWP